METDGKTVTRLEFLVTKLGFMMIDNEWGLLNLKCLLKKILKKSQHIYEWKWVLSMFLICFYFFSVTKQELPEFKQRV